MSRTVWAAVKSQSGGRYFEGSVSGSGAGQRGNHTRRAYGGDLRQLAAVALATLLALAAPVLRTFFAAQTEPAQPRKDLSPS